LFNGLALGALLALIASGLTIIYGTLGVLNLAHGAMFMLGGYAGYAAYQATGSFLVGIVAGTLAVGVLGIVLERVIIRHFYQRPHEDQLLLTFGLAIVFVEAVRWYFSSETKSAQAPQILSGISNLGFMFYPTYRLAVVGICAVALLALFFVLYRTRLGMIVRAGIEDAEMVDSLGINVDRVFMTVFGIGALYQFADRFARAGRWRTDPRANLRRRGDRRRRLLPRRGAGRPDCRRDHQPHFDGQSGLCLRDAVRRDDARAHGAAARTPWHEGARVTARKSGRA
jgi:hypothetical protein